MKEVQMFIFIFFSLLYNVYGQNPTNDSNWQLHWFDEFNDNSVDDTKWNYKRYGQTCWGDYCLTNYDANRREVNNSKLELICRKENCSCYEVTDWSPYTVQYHNKSYTSGEVTSKETFKYGYFEIRSRIPELRNDPNYTGKGFGPNFWLFPLNGYTNPDVDYSEIDIYEIKGYDYQFTCNVHFSRSNGTGDFHLRVDNNHDGWDDLGNDFIINNFGNYHKFACEWTPNYINFYFDDKLVQSTNNSCADELDYMNLIINCAINSMNFGLHVDATSKWPYTYEIDYVRIYKLKMDCYDQVTSSEGNGFNFNNFDYKVKKSFMLSNTSVPQNSKVTLRATDYFELGSGFTVPLGSELTLAPTPCH